MALVAANHATKRLRIRMHPDPRLRLLALCGLAAVFATSLLVLFPWRQFGGMLVSVQGSAAGMGVEGLGCHLNGQNAERIRISWHTTRNFSMLTYTQPDIVSDRSITGPHFFEEATVNYTVNTLKRINESGAVQDPWFLDIGANVGVYSLAVSAAGFRVASFEAFPPTAARLQCSRLINGFQRMEIIHTALGQHNGTSACLDVSPDTKEQRRTNNFGGIRAKETIEGLGKCRDRDRKTVVPITKLDDYFDGRWAGRPGPSVVKVDCEGCEMAALLGYARWFPVHKPLLILAELIPEFLGARNYTTHQVAQWVMGTAPGYRLFSADFSTEISADKVADAAGNTRLDHHCLSNVVFVRKDVAGSIVPLQNPGGCTM